MKTKIKGYDVCITQWTKRPKANGFYFTVKKPASPEFVNELKKAIEIDFNINIRTYFETETSTGFVISEEEAKTISIYGIQMALRNVR